jgi:hypothetical protein
MARTKQQRNVARYNGVLDHNSVILGSVLLVPPGLHDALGSSDIEALERQRPWFIAHITGVSFTQVYLFLMRLTSLASRTHTQGKGVRLCVYG